MMRPQCTILAGPNGSGKSSIYNKMRGNLPGEFINADEIALSLKARTAPELDTATLNVKAARLTIARVTQNIAAKRSFVFETTLSSRHALGVMKRARDVGFDVALIYVILDSSRRNLARIHLRVRGGGHHIPDADVIRRYETSLNNLSTALTLPMNGSSSTIRHGVRRSCSKRAMI